MISRTPSAPATGAGAADVSGDRRGRHQSRLRRRPRVSLSAAVVSRRGAGYLPPTAAEGSLRRSYLQRDLLVRSAGGCCISAADSETTVLHRPTPLVARPRGPRSRAPRPRSSTRSVSRRHTPLIPVPLALSVAQARGRCSSACSSCFCWRAAARCPGATPSTCTAWPRPSPRRARWPCPTGSRTRASTTACIPCCRRWSMSPAPGFTTRSQRSGRRRERGRWRSPVTSARPWWPRWRLSCSCSSVSTWGCRLGVAGFGGLVLGLGTMVAVYARVAWSEIVQVCCFIGFYRCLLRVADTPSRAAAIAVGVWGGLLVNSKLVLHQLSARRGAVRRAEDRPAARAAYRGPRDGVGPGGGPARLVMLFGYSLVRTGSILGTGYGVVSSGEGRAAGVQ